MSKKVKILYCFDFDLLHVGKDENGKIFIFEFAHEDEECNDMLKDSEISVGKSVYLDNTILCNIPENEFNNMCKVILDNKG